MDIVERCFFVTAATGVLLLISASIWFGLMTF